MADDFSKNVIGFSKNDTYMGVFEVADYESDIKFSKENGRSKKANHFTNNVIDYY